MKELEKKVERDCDIILEQLAEIKKLEGNFKVAQQQAKSSIKKLQNNLKEASSLF